MSESIEQTSAQPTAVRNPGTDWLLTAFLVYFLAIAAVITLFIIIAWRNGS